MKVQTNARYYTARVVMEYFEHTTNAVLVNRHKLFGTCIGHDLYSYVRSIFQHLHDKKVTKMCPKYSLTLYQNLSPQYRIQINRSGEIKQCTQFPNVNPACIYIHGRDSVYLFYMYIFTVILRRARPDLVALWLACLIM